MLFESGDQIEITYLEGDRQDQLSCTLIEERDGLLHARWGYDKIVFNMRSQTFVRARLLHPAPRTMTPDEASAWHRERLEAVHEAFEDLDRPVDRAARGTPLTASWLATLEPAERGGAHGGQKSPRAAAEAAANPTVETAAALHRRWQGYLGEARVVLGQRAPFQRIAMNAAARWLQREPPELAFVASELLTLLKAERHDSVETEFLTRAEGGEMVGFRHVVTGDVVYLAPEHLDRLPLAEREHYQPYDPLLARVLRAATLDQEIDEMAAASEEG